MESEDIERSKSEGMAESLKDERKRKESKAKEGDEQRVVPIWTIITQRISNNNNKQHDGPGLSARHELYVVVLQLGLLCQPRSW